MNKLIFVENYVFGAEWFHSAGVKRVDTRTKERRAEELVSGKIVTPKEWPVTLQLYIRSPDDTLRVLNFQSRAGEEMTIDLFIDVLEQLMLEVMFEEGDKVTYGKQEIPNAYKAFLMEDLQIQAKPGKENKDDRRQEEQHGRGPSRGDERGDDGDGGGTNRGGTGESNSPGTAGPPEGVSNQ